MGGFTSTVSGFGGVSLQLKVSLWKPPPSRSDLSWRGDAASESPRPPEVTSRDAEALHGKAPRPPKVTSHDAEALALLAVRTFLAIAGNASYSSLPLEGGGPRSGGGSSRMLKPNTYAAVSKDLPQHFTVANDTSRAYKKDPAASSPKESRKVPSKNQSSIFPLLHTETDTQPRARFRWLWQSPAPRRACCGGGGCGHRRCGCRRNIRSPRCA